METGYAVEKITDRLLELMGWQRPLPAVSVKRCGRLDVLPGGHTG